MRIEELKAFYQSRGLGNKMGFGKRPAILVVDFVKGFTDSEAPLGGNFGSELAQTLRILTMARKANLPIMFSTVSYHPNMLDAGVWHHKIPAGKTMVNGSGFTEPDPALAYNAETETIVVKKFASAFFGTDLATQLISKEVDTLIITGCTTSGCVRASAVDSCQYGFRTIVALEAVGDRAREPHLANLFDIDSKYGDVISVDEILEYLKTYEL